MGDIFSVILPFIGAFFLGPLGYALGTLAAGALFSKDIVQKGSKVTDFQVQNASSGISIPYIHGKMKVSGNIIWQRGFQEHKRREKVADGGFFGSDQYVDIFYYSNVVAVGLCKNDIAGIKRIWFDGKLEASINNKEKDDTFKYESFFTNEQLLTNNNEKYIDEDGKLDIFESVKSRGLFNGIFGGGSKKNDRSWNFTTFFDSNKTKSEHILAKEGDLTPRFKNLSYMVFRFGDLTDWGHRVPNIEVEVVEKTIDKNIEVMDDEESLVVVSKEERKYDANIIDLLKQTDIEQDTENYQQFYFVTNFGFGSYLDSRQVTLYNYNEVNRDVDNINSIKYDARWSLRQNGFVYDNGVKEIRLDNTGTVVNNVKDFAIANTSTPYILNENVRSFTKIKSVKAPVYSNSFQLQTINQVSTGKRLSFRILTNTDYQCNFIIDDYDIYEQFNEEIKSINRKGIEIVSPINNLFIKSIDGRRVERHFDYNNKTPILLCMNNENTRVYIYIVNIFYNNETLKYDYTTELSKTLNVTQYLSSTAQVRAGHSSNLMYFDYSNFGSAKKQKLYYDPRFKVLINFTDNEILLYKNDTGNLLKRVYEEDNSQNANVFDEDREIFNIYVSYKAGLNLIVQYIENFDEVNQTADLYETTMKLSYWKDGELPRDYTTYLDEVVYNMLIESGYKYEEIDVSNLSSIEILDGYIYGDESPARNHIERLQASYQFNILEEDWKFVAKTRGGSIDKFLSYDKDIGYGLNAQDAKISRMITSSTELPTKININYASSTNAYIQNTQSAEYPADHFKEISIELPMSMPDSKAAQIADINLAVMHREIYRFDFNVSLEHIDLNIGDLLDIEGEVVRISGIDISKNFIKITAVSDALSAYFSEVMGVEINQDIINQIEFEQVLELVSFQATALDRSLYDDQRPRIYYTALGNVSTQSKGVLFSSTDNIEYEEDEPISITSGFGGVVAEDNIVNNKGFDTSELIVDFNFDVGLSSATKEDLFKDRYLNLIAIIHTKTDVEYIQFKDAEKVEGTESRYKLTNLLRGRFNSIIVDIDQGTPFVAINDALYVKSFNKNRTGTYEYNKLISSYLDLEDAEVVNNIIQGENLRPREPLLLDYVIENGIITVNYNAIANVNEGWNDESDSDISNLTFIATSYDINDNVLEEITTKDLSLDLNELDVDRVEIYTQDDNNNLLSKRALQIEIGA